MGGKNEKKKGGEGGKLSGEYSVSRLCCVRSRKFAGRAAVFSSVWTMKEKPIKSPRLCFRPFRDFFFACLSFCPLETRDKKRKKREETKWNPHGREIKTGI